MMTGIAAQPQFVLPQTIAATGRYETLASGSGESVWVYDPEGNPFVSTDSETAENIAKTLNKLEFSCSCGCSCGDNCKCK